MRLYAILGAMFAFLALSAAPVQAESASNGPRTLTISKATGLNPDGDTIFVSGSGFDESKGIYIALCVRPAPGAMPSPCGGGADIAGTGGVSLWISSNPPSYGVGLAVPYGPGGSFSGSISVGPMIGSVDCRVTACAITTRSDHTRLQDRSQDVIIPVTFRSAEPPTPVPPTATQPAAPTATPPPGATATATVTQAASPSATASAGASTSVPPTSVASPTSAPALPSVVLTQDNRTATRGSLSATASKVSGLDPAEEQVTVTGRGYDTSRGIYVALCSLKSETAIGTCASGSTETSAWISSNPPSYANGRARPYGDNGSFDVSLKLSAVIDDRTDCRQVKCAITTRNDDTVTGGAAQELFIPVTFAAESSGGGGTGDSVGLASSGDEGGTPVLPFIAAGAALLVILGAGSFFYRKRAAGSVATVIAVALFFGACGSSGGTDPGAENSPGAVLPVTVHSADGKDVTVTSNARIVTLWGNITEVAVGLGLTDNLVGRDVTSTLDEVSHLPEVTKAHDVSVEGVLSLNPTIVIGSKENTGPAEAIEHIRNVGVPVVIIDDPKTVDDIGPRIQLIAKILGVPEKGDEMAAKAQSDVAAVLKSLPADQPHPKVAFLYMRGNAGVYLIGGPGSGADSMIAAAGGQDAGTLMGLSNAFTPLTSEALAKAAPDVILMSVSGLESVGGIEGLVKIPGIAQTPAGRSRAVITIGEDLLYNFGLRTPDAIEKLSSDIYAAVKASR